MQILLKILLFNILFGTLLVNSFAQNKVKDQKYEVMLNYLLTHDVKESPVSSILINTDSIVYLDAREKREYQISHIKNAIWTGYDTFNMSRVKHLPKNTKIVIYCSVGYRSEVISRKLMKKGFTNISNLYGGIFEWVNQGGKIYDMKNQETDKVHAYDKAWGVWLQKGIKVYK